MFLGHYATAMAAKRLEPRLPLAATFFACQFLDLLWPILVLSGFESVRTEAGATAVTPLDFEHYPWSHSLVMTLVWGVAVAALALLFKRTAREAMLLGLLVASHWVIDLIAHRPDLPLAPGTAKVGLGLWQSVPATLVVEFGMFAAGIWLYLKAGGPQRKAPFWSLIAFLGLVYLGNLFGPAPPTDAPPAMIAGPALAMWLLVAWAWWAERPKGRPNRA